MRREVIKAKNAGFCFGVDRAVKLTEETLAKEKTVYCLGSLIHNPQMVKHFEQEGLRVVQDVEKIPDGSTVIIRSHGTTVEVEQRLKKKKAKIVNATCPFVKNAQMTAERLAKDADAVVVCGDPDHAEVVGIVSRAPKKIIVLETLEQAKKLGSFSRLALLSQTTQKLEKLKEIAAELVGHSKQLTVGNTICLDTSVKQKEIKDLSKKVDVMIVVGGKGSSNTKKLFQLSKKNCPQTHHIETADELKKSWFQKKQKIGVAAGASTPSNLLEEVVKGIKKLNSADV